MTKVKPHREWCIRKVNMESGAIRIWRDRTFYYFLERYEGEQ